MIRTGSYEDAELLAGLIRSSYADVADRLGLTAENAPTHPSNCRTDWVERDLASGVSYYLLECEGAPAGCVALEIASDSLGYLERLAVAPSWRRRGLGRRLVEHAIEAAAREGLVTVSIGVIDEEVELISWYERLGFRRTATRCFAHLPFEVCFLECRVA